MRVSSARNAASPCVVKIWEIGMPVFGGDQRVEVEEIVPQHDGEASSDGGLPRRHEAAENDVSLVFRHPCPVCADRKHRSCIRRSAQRSTRRKLRHVTQPVKQYLQARHERLNHPERGGMTRRIDSAEARLDRRRSEEAERRSTRGSNTRWGISNTVTRTVRMHPVWQRPRSPRHTGMTCQSRPRSPSPSHPLSVTATASSIFTWPTSG